MPRGSWQVQWADPLLQYDRAGHREPRTSASLLQRSRSQRCKPSGWVRAGHRASWWTAWEICHLDQMHRGCAKIQVGLVGVIVIAGKWDAIDISGKSKRQYTGWWCGTFGLFFHSVGTNHPNWRTPSFFQRGRSTTNQYIIYHHICIIIIYLISCIIITIHYSPIF